MAARAPAGYGSTHMQSARADNLSRAMGKVCRAGGRTNLRRPHSVSPQLCQSSRVTATSTPPLLLESLKSPPHGKLYLNSPSPLWTTTNRPTGNGGSTVPVNGDRRRSLVKYHAASQSKKIETLARSTSGRDRSRSSSYSVCHSSALLDASLVVVTWRVRT